MKNSAKRDRDLTVVSLALIGGAFFGLFYLVRCGSIEPLTAVLADIDVSPPRSRTAPPSPPAPRSSCCAPSSRSCCGAAFAGAFVKPYILVSVMRRYIEARRADTPQVDVYDKLSGMSKGFKKALDRAGEGAPSAA